MKRFARLFEFKNGQLLLTVGEISDIPGTTLSIETQSSDGVAVGTGLSFSKRADAEAAMDELTTGKAEELHGALIALTTDPGQLPKVEQFFFDSRNAGQA